VLLEMDVDSLLKQKISSLKLDPAPFNVNQLTEELKSKEDKDGGGVSQEKVAAALVSLGLDGTTAERHARDFFGYADPKHTGFVKVSDFVQEWTRMQIFKSVRYLLFLQQKRSQTTDQAVKSDEIKKVLSEQVGSEFGEKYYGDLLFLVESDGSKGVPMKDIALWYFCRVKQANRIGARRSALLIIDVQYDFLPPTGSLAVTDGQAIIPVINKLRQRVKFDIIAHSQDWHPSDHISFYVNHKEDPKAKLFTPYQLSNGSMQVMWPAHCIQGSEGAKFHKDLLLLRTDKIVKKGLNRDVDSYSAFFDNDHKKQTEMASVLKANNITDVWVVGLAYDYCVGYSALDAFTEGLRVAVIEDATRGVAPDSIKAMKEKLASTGITIIQSKDVPLSGLLP